MNKHEIFADLENLASIIPAPLYWLDTNGVFLGGNQRCLDVTGAKSLDMFIGKSYDEIHPKDIAEKLVQNIKSVIETKKVVETEEFIKDFETGKTRYFLAIRGPLYENDKIVGIIATSIEITAEKEKERLEIQNAVYEAEIKAQKVFKECMNGIQHLMQQAKISAVSNKTGTQMEINEYDKKIALTKREREILFFLAMGKTPKEIASIISAVDGKEMSYGTIGAFINKQLYPKFNVGNVSQLVEKATLLNLIPFLDDDLL